MSQYLSARLRAGVMLLALMVILALTVAVAQANVRLEGAGDVPFYARIEQNEVLTDGTWAAIVFYRPPSCVPSDFNLLLFFDIPGAFFCQPYTTDGFSLWQNGPDIDPAPYMTHLQGLGAVPVWFVSWAELEPAMADSILTMTELSAMPSQMQGTASFYNEVLHPSGGGHPRSKIQLVARGQLADGRNFFVEATSGHYFNVNIRFD